LDFGGKGEVEQRPFKSTERFDNILQDPRSNIWQEKRSYPRSEKLRVLVKAPSLKIGEGGENEGRGEGRKTWENISTVPVKGRKAATDFGIGGKHLP